MDFLRGTYLGLTPTDESAVVMGEQRAVFSNTELTVSTATGLQIQTETHQLGNCLPLTRDELAAKLTKPRRAKKFQAFRIGEDSEVLLLFRIRPLLTPALEVCNGMSSLLGPTVLYNAQQVRWGLFKWTIRRLERKLGKRGDIPRLSNRGQAPNQCE